MTRSEPKRFDLLISTSGLPGEMLTFNDTWLIIEGESEVGITTVNSPLHRLFDSDWYRQIRAQEEVS
jgi:hypothetical protein